ncbi:MAG: hypothetical protein LH478_03230 [Chitinophagaceae bacterium]|nr:hypothetical protein [Chitinophagaceae bacterium]
MTRVFISVFIVFSWLGGFCQVKKYISFWENPPLNSIQSLVEETKKPNWDSTYPVSKQAFIQLLLQHSTSKLNDSVRERGVRFFLEGKEYETYASFQYDQDLLGRFKQAGYGGGCGLMTGYIWYKTMPGNEKEAKQFVKQIYYQRTTDPFHLGESIYNDSTGEEKFVPMNSAIDVGGLIEDTVIKRMLSSKLFLYASRVANDCDGEGSSNYILTKRKYIFGASTPNRVAGLNFVTSFFRTLYKKYGTKVEVKVTPIKEFYYNIIIKGPARCLSLEHKNMWEVIRLNVWFEGGLTTQPDEMEVLIRFDYHKYAKGPEAASPATTRFVRIEDGYYAELEVGHENTIISQFATACRGSIN